MKLRSIQILFAVSVLLLAIASPLAPQDVPAAPSGFEWKHLEEIKAFFLIPNGWFFKSESNKGTMAYFITKQDISNGGDY